MIEAASTLATRAASLSIVLATAWVVGDALVSRLTARRDAETTGLAFSCGLGVMGLAAFGLAMSGIFRFEAVAAALTVLHLVRWRRWRDLIRSLPRARVRSAWLSLALAVVVVPPALLACSPPWGFDATMYHLPHAQAMVSTASAPFLPQLRFPVFPQLHECLFALGMLLGDDTVPALLEWSCLILTAMVTGGLGTRLISDRAGIWAAALWFGTPVAMAVGCQAYVDVGLTLFTVSALSAWDHWRTRDDGRWLIVAGAFAGFAASTKYLGALTVFGIGLACLSAAERPWKHRVRGAVLALSIACVVALPWYWRILVWTGNPVFPFYGALFGASEWSLPEHGDCDEPGTTSSPTEVLLAHACDVRTGMGQLMTVTWRSYLRRADFDFQAPLDPWSGVLIWLGVSVTVLQRELRRKLLGPALVAGCFLLFWPTTIRDLRFLLPALPVVHLLSAAALDRLLPRAARTAPRDVLSRWTVAGLLSLMGPIWCVHTILERPPGLPTPEGRESYLLAHVDGYAALSGLERSSNGPRTLYALGGPWLQYHVRGLMLGDEFGPFRYDRIAPHLGDSESLYARLRRWNVDTLLVDRRTFDADALFGSSHPHFHLEYEDQRWVAFALLPAEREADAALVRRD